MPLLRSAGNGQLFIQGTSPAGAGAGNLWYDTVNNVLKFFDNSVTAQTVEWQANRNIASGYPALTANSQIAGVPMKLVTASITGSAATNFTATLPSTNKNLIVILDCVSTSGIDTLSLQFNGDTAANYYKDVFPDVSAATTGTSTKAELEPANNAGARYYVFFIRNITAEVKTGRFSGFYNSGNLNGVLTWNNTNAQITSIKCFTTGGSNTMPVGTTMTVLGYDD